MPDEKENNSRLQHLALEDGTLAIIAIDQRPPLRAMFSEVGVVPDPELLSSFKLEVSLALMPASSGILLDPDYGRKAISRLVQRASIGVLIAAEPEYQNIWQGEPRVHRDSKRDAPFVAALGGDALKFLLRFRPDRKRFRGGPDLVAEALDVARTVVADCRSNGMCCVMECLLYDLPGEPPLTGRVYEDLVVESARVFDEVGPDLLKLPYPGSEKGCTRLADVLHRPWAVLSAGIEFEEFETVLLHACDAGGASGFIAGRSFWREAVGLVESQQRRFLQGVALERVEHCRSLLSGHAVPVTAASRRSS